MDASGPTLALVASFALAFAVSCGVLAGLLASGLARRVLDRPNARSMHATPTPRIGGAGIVCGSVAAIVLLQGALPWPVWAGLATVAAVSAIDDVRGLRAAQRLPLHLLAAGLVASGLAADSGWAAAIVATLAVAWMLNLYNFMDGSDALAGSMGTIGFGACALAATVRGDLQLAAACAAISGAAAGFLPFNLPPARIFMGDLGSTALGLLAGAVGVLGVERGLWSPWLPATVFAPFVLDASATLADRLVRGCRVWEAHREHAYQRLNLGGLGHRRTAAAYAALMAGSAAAALAGQALEAEGAALVGTAAVHAALWLGVRFGWLTGRDRGRPRA
jgi:UDP-N-acetylmuramyl pentapeptide phosphotransferase/UDP-N-acetylglucosamine-1-phosphate transferase